MSEEENSAKPQGEENPEANAAAETANAATGAAEAGAAATGAAANAAGNTEATEGDSSAEDATADAKADGGEKGASDNSKADANAASEPPKVAPAEPDWKDRYARLLADFDNFKKRTARDREDTYRYAEGDILKDILPTVDNLCLALSKTENKDDPFVKGVQLSYDNLLKALKDHGAEPFDCVGKELDTEKMEAIAHLPSPDVEEGKVSIESKRGWMLRDRVLRAAQVVVSSGKGEANG